jgi:hypothetical protein
MSVQEAIIFIIHHFYYLRHIFPSITAGDAQLTAEAKSIKLDT